MTGTSGLAMVDDPPVSLTTFRIPPLPTLASRKIVSRLCRLPAGSVRGTSKALYAKMSTPWLKKLQLPPGPLEAPHAVGDLEGGPAVDTWGSRPRRLARRVAGHLVLEEDHPAAIAVPDRLVLLVVLDKQAVGRHVVAVDDHTCIGGVDRRADAVAVVGAPGPGVVQDGVVAVDLEAHRRLAGGGAADPEEHVLQGRRVIRVAVVSVRGADLQQQPGVLGTGIDDDARDVNSRNVGDSHRDIATLWHDRRETQAEGCPRGSP